MKNWAKILIFLICISLVILFLFLYIKRADIYAKLGSYYTKKDNYNAAQYYYEQSYILGNKEKTFRENYVNLLINSPLTIDAQERLVDIAEGKIKDTASESAKYFLYNLKREIHNKYPNNYIQQAPYNQKIIHWGKMPITYSFKQTKYASPDVIKAVNDAFDSWERASSARIRFEQNQIKSNIVVTFKNNTIKSPKYGEKYVIAYTFPEISSEKLNQMTMVLNITNIDGAPFTPNQIYNIALHEIFHALGFMGHSFDKNNIMYIAQDGAAMINNERNVIQDSDKVTLELFYKIRPDITNSNELNYEYISYPVIGNNAEVNYAKADEAKKYIKKAPHLPSGYVDLAQTLINEKDYPSAIINLKKALFLSKSDDAKYLALYNLAIAHYCDEDYELALFYIKKAMELKNDEDIHWLSAKTYENLRDSDSAVKEYLYLISIKPDNIEYNISLANIYITKHKYIRARKVLKNYIKRNPRDKNNPRFKPCRMLLL